MHILIDNILQNMTDMTNIGIANKYKVAYSLSIDIFTFSLGPILKVKVKIMHISTEYLANGDR